MVQSADPSASSSTHGTRRLEILREAAAVFREKGFHAAGMREIAARLGLRAGALYYYFPSKTELLEACQEASLDRLLGKALGISEREASAAERLRALVAHHLEVILDVLGGSAVHLRFDAIPARRRKRLLARRDQYEALFRDVVREGVEDGAFRSVDPKAAALALLGALNGTALWWRPGGTWSAADVARDVADVFLHGLEAASENTREVTT